MGWKASWGKRSDPCMNQASGQVLGSSSARTWSREFVIGGYIPGSRGFDALLVGVYEKEELIFVAKVKDGFVPRIPDELLWPLRRCKLPSTTSAAQQTFLIDTK